MTDYAAAEQETDAEADRIAAMLRNEERAALATIRKVSAALQEQEDGNSISAVDQE